MTEQEDKELLENFECYLGFCIPPHCQRYNPPDFMKPENGESKWEADMIRKFLSARHRISFQEGVKAAAEFATQNLPTEELRQKAVSDYLEHLTPNQ